MALLFMVDEFLKRFTFCGSIHRKNYCFADGLAFVASQKKLFLNVNIRAKFVEVRLVKKIHGKIT